MAKTTETKAKSNRLDTIVSKLLLPDDLTPHTKLVLNAIYEKFDKNLRDMTDNADLLFLEMMDTARRKFALTTNIFADKRRAEMKYFIEYLLKNDDESVLKAVVDESRRSARNGGVNDDRQSGRVSSEDDDDAMAATAATIPPEDANDSVGGGMAMATAAAGCDLPGPLLRQRFTNHLRELNHILESILCQREEAGSSVEEENKQYDCNATCDDQM